MTLDVFTLVLDGQPFVLWHLPMLNALPASVDWHWWIVEGTAANVNCTKWCSSQPPRLSKDGSSEYLTTIHTHPRVTLIRKQFWEGGKLQMCQAVADKIERPTVLLECDVDEIWRGEQILELLRLFNMPEFQNKNCAYFFCRYFVGPNIIASGHNVYGNKLGEWLRAFRFAPGMKWKSHEPPIMANFNHVPFTREMTSDCGLVFDHYAYMTVEQVAWKEKYYKYPNAVSQWQRLQGNTQFPVKLKDFLPWVKDEATADWLWKP